MLLFIQVAYRNGISSFHFNTSHVTVYHLFDISPLCSTSISIHLMLLFIVETFFISVLINLFQYISCYCLSKRGIRVYGTYSISIHLMLLFIKVLHPNGLSLAVFQYISCYCLSHSGESRFRKIHYFNTSHVTVYPYSGQTHTYDGKFQYISCYCLSSAIICLATFLKNFNTSHVTVYRRWDLNPRLFA